MSAAFEIESLDPGEHARLAEAFPGAEGEVAWLAANPAGTRFWLAREGGVPRAWLAGVGRRVWLAGREARFASLGDVRGDPRRGGHEPSSGADWAAACAETLGPDGDLVQLAWPSEAAWREGRFAGFDVVRTQHVLVRPLDGGGHDGGEGEGPPDAPVGVETPERFDHEARWLWDRCAGGFHASAIRDADALNWRFADHPLHRYRILAVRGAEGPVAGYAVWRPADWLVPRTAVVVDWLVPPEEGALGALLLDALAATARREGARALATLLVEWSPWFERFQRAGFLVHPSPLVLAARSSWRRIDQLWLREGLWVTLADTELV